MTFKFTAHIKLVDDDEITSITSGQDATDQHIVRALLIGWDNFVDDGVEVAFSPETLNEMIRFGGISGKLSVECINAQYRVQEKN